MSRSPVASEAPKIGCSSGAVRKSPPRPGLRLGRPVVAAVRVVQGERHEPDERHRAVVPGSRPGCARRARRPRRPRRGPAPARGAARCAGPPSATPSERQPQPRPDERVAAEHDRDRRIAGGLGERPQPRVGDALGEEQVARRAVLERRPAALVRAEPVGQQDPAVDDRRIAPAAPGADRATPVRRARGAPRGRTPAAAGRRRPCAGRAPRRATRVRDAVAVSSQAMVVADVRPATSSSAADPQRRPGSPPSRRWTASRSAGVRCRAQRAAEQDEVERGVDVDAEPPDAAPIVDRHARFGQPAGQRRCRCRGRAGPPGRGARRRWPGCRPSSGCWRGRRASRPSPPLPVAAAVTNRRRSAAVASGTAPEPRTTRPSPASSRAATRAQPRAERRRPSDGSLTISARVAPAARNPTRCRSASAARARADGRGQWPVGRVRGAGGGWRP